MVFFFNFPNAVVFMTLEWHNVTKLEGMPTLNKSKSYVTIINVWAIT